MRPSDEEKGRNLKRAWGASLKRAALPLVVLAVGGALAVWLVETSPQIRKGKSNRQARLVEVETIRFTDQRAAVQAMGTVKPAQEVTLHPLVSGKVISISEEFVPGGSFMKGQAVLQIDPADYELTVQQRRSEVTQAKSELELEKGQQAVAKREYELLGETIKPEESDLVLRKPQLDKARATLENAQAALKQAKLNLERTEVKAPFDATVLSREVNVGTQVNTSTALATLVGTEKYWIEATLPVDQLKWITFPDSGDGTGSASVLRKDGVWDKNEFREGAVVRLLGSLEEEGRMARLLIEVNDPLSLKEQNAGKPILLLGDYVRTDIRGVLLESVAVIDREYIRNGNQIWIMNDQDRLEIRTIDIAFRGRDRVFIRNGLKQGERLVTTLLSAPVEGMELRTGGDSQPTKPVTKSPGVPAGAAEVTRN